MRLFIAFHTPRMRLTMGYRIDEEAAKDAKARRVVRSNNFTQQTNTLDVDKHMYGFLPFPLPPILNS